MDVLYPQMWYFLLYAFLGWCAEVTFAAVREGRFVNRGFLNGPVCPIYGVGLVLVCCALKPLDNNIFLLYLGATLLTTALELVTGYLMEKLFRQRWWDYSGQKWNIGGYVCLSASLVWGAACVVIVRLMHPLVVGLVDLLPVQLGMPILIFLMMLLAADTAVTVVSVNHLNRRLRQLDEMGKFLKTVSDSLGENVADGAMLIKKKGEDIMTLLRGQQEKQRDSLDAVQRRLLSAFPRMRSIRYPGVLEELKRRLAERRRK